MTKIQNSKEKKGDKKWYLVIIGLSGSGKGTQAKLLAGEFNLVHISTGDFFRKEIEQKTEVGKKIENLVNTGQWIPDELVFQVARPYLEDGLKKGFIVDGFPRTVSQAEILEKFLTESGVKLDAVLFLEIRPEIILARREKVVKRGERFQEGRADDSVEIFKKRFRSYQKTISPILDFYQKKGLLIRIDGERSIEDIFKDILMKLEALGKNK